MRNLFTTLLLILLMITGNGCKTQYTNVPSGYVGKLLTPVGFRDKLYNSGQVDIGTVDQNNLGNSLILVENTSITVKESFLGSKANSDGEDHRIVLEDSIPLSVDVRLSFMTPDFAEKDSDKLFTLITPEPFTKDNVRIQVIKLDRIYENLARLEVRTAIRETFDKHGKNYKYATTHRQELNTNLSSNILKVIKESGIPLKVKMVDLSMLMPDESIWKRDAQISSAEAQITVMKKLAKEIQEMGPHGMEIYNLMIMKEAVELGNKNGTPIVIWPLSLIK